MNLILFETHADRYHLEGNDERHRHISRILKAAPDDTLRVGIVGGPEGTATVVHTGKEGTDLEVRWERPGRSPLPVDVILGHPRPPVLQRLGRDLASMRIRRLVVFPGDLGERSYTQSSAWDTLDARLREGLSQGRHTALPEVRRVSRLEDALVLIGEGRRYYGALDHAGVISFHDMLSEMAGDLPRVRPVFLCIGPERGLSNREIRLLSERSFRPVSLGTSVLRTETATNGFVVGVTSVLCRSVNPQV
ncbi:MAG: RsmE family RNA methyltransferase, partial [Alkalispirochaeta sp.]